MIVIRVAEAEHRLGPLALARRPRQAVQHDRVELLLDPGRHSFFLARVRVGEGDFALGVDGNFPVESTAVEVAVDESAETAEVLPRGSRRQGLLEQGYRGVVGVLALERPGEGYGGKVADFLILLAVKLARLLGCIASVD